MSVIFKNNATSTLAEDVDVNQTLITIRIADAELFPSPLTGEWFPLTLVDRSGNLEIVHCTQRTGTSFNVTRGREGTTPRAFSEGSVASHRLTAEALTALVVAGVIAADSPPQPPLDNGQLWWESDSGAMFIWYDDGDSAQWVQVGGGGGGSGNSGSSVYVGDTAPEPPLHMGQLWWKANTGNLYIWYEDIDNGQWVQINSAVSSGAGGGGASISTINDATGMSFLSSMLVIETQSYSVVPIRGGARYKRMSKAAIDLGAYPTSSYFRSADRFLPDGTSDATNGGYWLLDEIQPTPFMLGGIGDGIADDTATLNAALDYLFAKGALGGEVDLSGGRWLVDSGDIVMRHGTGLVGGWYAGGNLNLAGTGDHHTNRSCIVLNPPYTIKMWDSRTSLKGLTILRKGINNPTTMRESINEERAMTGTAVTIGGASGRGSSSYVGFCFFIGFDFAVNGSWCGQSVFEYVWGDCRNGIHLSEIHDWAHVDHCHFWPWLLGGTYFQQYTVTNAVNNGSGLVRITVAPVAPVPPVPDHVPLVTGDYLNIRQVGGTTEINEKRWTITVIDPTTFDLQGSVFTNAFTSAGEAAISPYSHPGGTAYKLGPQVDGGQIQNSVCYGYDTGFAITNSAFNQLLNCSVDYHALAQDYTTIGIHMYGDDFHMRNPQAIGCRVTGVGTGVLIDVPGEADFPGQGVVTAVQDFSSTGCRKYGIRVVRGYAVITAAIIEVTNTGIAVEATADGVSVVGSKTITMTTPISIAPAVLHACTVLGNHFPGDVTVGERRVVPPSNIRTHYMSEFSNGGVGVTLNYQKGRGTAKVPVAALSGDYAVYTRGGFWDGVDTFRIGGSYRIQALANVSPTSAPAAHIWGAAAIGSASLVDRIGLDAAAFYPITHRAMNIGKSTSYFESAFVGYMTLRELMATPTAVSGGAQMWVDSTGAVKIMTGAGVVKTFTVT